VPSTFWAVERTFFATVPLPGSAVLTMRQVTFWPTWGVTVLPPATGTDVCVPVITQVHGESVYPDGPDSESVYGTPPFTGPLIEATRPPTGVPVPESAGTCPSLAVRVHRSAVAMPPPVLTTCFSSVRTGFFAVFVNVQATFPPAGTTTVLSLIDVPPVEQTRFVQSYPVIWLISARLYVPGATCLVSPLS
jgi:hypothetical protein